MKHTSMKSNFLKLIFFTSQPQKLFKKIHRVHFIHVLGSHTKGRVRIEFGMLEGEVVIGTKSRSLLSLGLRFALVHSVVKF